MTDESIFATALELKTADERRAYLDQACAGNPALRAEVEALLSAEAGAGSFLNHPPVGSDATIAMTGEHDTVEAGGGPVSLAFLLPSETPGRLGQLDHYEVIEVVGQGGMGMVLRAFDTKLSRIVAVKVMAPELAANPQAVKRFKREASAAAAVHHDHVVTIHAVEDQHKPPYIVMQFIEGQTLQQKIDREGALGLKQILRIGSQMAAGLAAAHKLGLIHRDVKPANILLENGVERVKITDFGLARATDDLEMTQTGMIAGTPQYMSPEQAKGEAVDARSDLFSLGSVLYTMCTGRPGFRAETTMGVLKRVCEESPRPIREVNAEVPAWLETIVAKLLAKVPADRFQSAGEVAELLSQHLAHEQNPVQVARPATVMLPRPPLPMVMAPQPSNALPMVLVTVLLAVVGLPLLVAAVAVGGYFFSHSSVRKQQPHLAQGVVTLRLSHPEIEYVIDGYGPNQTAVSSMQLPLDAGGHRVWFKRGDLELDTGTFYVTEGGRHELELEISPDKAQALWDGLPLVLTLVAGTPPPGTALAGGSPSANPWPPTLVGFQPVSESAQPWQSLFNGQDLTSWQPHPVDSTAWTVKDGTIVGRGTNSYLFSARAYNDFWLRAEVKINAAGDGGLLVRMSSPTEPEVAKSGYEVQITGDPNHVSPTASVIAHGTAPATATAMNGAGGTAVGSGTLIQPDQWFFLEVLATGGRLRVAINNQLAVDYRDEDSPRTSGHIALQSFSEATEISFRKIEIQELRASAEWTPLFNGQDLAGWQAIPPQLWKVEKGVIHGSGPDAYLVTERGDFEDFHLAAEFRINAEGDSGIHFRSPPPESHEQWRWGQRVTGLEAEIGIQKAAGYRTGALTSKQTPSIVLASSSLPPQPPNKWTRMEIIAQGNHIQILLNDQIVTDFLDEKRTFRRGHIALASWEDNRIKTAVEFRKVEIRTLSPDLSPKDSSADLLTSGDWEWTKPENLGPVINSEHNDGEPALSGDGLTLVFYSNRPGGQGLDDLWLATRPSLDAPWEAPANLGPAVNGPDTDGGPALSADAQTLIFHSNRPGGEGEADLWMSTRADAGQTWSPAVNLGANINSASEETAPALSADGLMLVFNSDRPGRHGQGDLWFSTRSSLDAPWSPARNFGPQVNSPAYQGFAALASDGLAMIFNSNGAGGPWSGPFRICTRATVNAEWSPPRGFWSDPLGAWSACLSADYQTLLFDSKRPGGQGEFDLWSSRRVRRIAAVRPADSAEVVALRELVAAKERDLAAAKAQFTKGTITPLGVKPAEAELLEAKIRLAEAQGDQAAVVARLKELVAVITEEKSLTQQRIDAGVDPTSALNDVEARLADAQARLAKAEADWQAAAPPPAAAPFDAAQAKAHQAAWARHLGVPIEFANPAGMKFRLIPPGRFTMGRSAEEIERLLPRFEQEWEQGTVRGQGPAVETEIQEPYYLATCELTTGLFRKFVEDTQHETTAERTGLGCQRWSNEEKQFVWDAELTWRKVHDASQPADPLPLLCVSPYDADVLCQWLTKQDGVAYALPTSAEWEHACRAGTTTLFWTGDTEESVLPHEWLGRESRKYLPVGTKSANPFGLFDMHGNAHEWARDADDKHWERGGLCWQPADYGHSANRIHKPDAHPQQTMGLRLKASVDSVRQHLAGRAP